MTSEGPRDVTVDVETQPDGIVSVSVTGDLDLATIDTVVARAKRYLNGQPGTLSVDLAGVGFCDSAGINGLVNLRHACDGLGWEFRIVNLQAPVRRVLVDLTGLGEFLRIAPPTSA